MLIVSEEDFVDWILVAADQLGLQHKHGVFQSMRDVLSRHCVPCFEAGGRTFEQ